LTETTGHRETTGRSNPRIAGTSGRDPRQIAVSPASPSLGLGPGKPELSASVYQQSYINSGTLTFTLKFPCPVLVHFRFIRFHSLSSRQHRHSLGLTFPTFSCLTTSTRTTFKPCSLDGQSAESRHRHYRLVHSLQDFTQAFKHRLPSSKDPLVRQT
jgi:hypothetical protein